MEQSGEKPHEATPRRREDARRKGQVPKSQDLVSAVLLIGALLILLFFGKSLSRYFAELAVGQFTETWLVLDSEEAIAKWNAIVFTLGQVMLPVFGLLLLVALAVNLGQVGFLFTPERVGLDFKRINPLQGVKRMFSLNNLVRLMLGLFKILVVGAVALWSIWGERETIMSLSELTAAQIGSFIVDITLWTCLKVGFALLILALIDFAYQRWKHEQDLRMTDQEMREEMRNQQGDPQIVARRRAVQRQLVLNRMNNIVPNADFVVTNPTELAVAVRYDHETMAAPVVIAKGAGLLAQRIRRKALESSVPIIERKELARALYQQVEVNHPIPADQYAAVAEILRYVYELKGKTLPTAA